MADPRGEQLREAFERYVQGPAVAGDAYHTVDSRKSRRGFYDVVAVLLAPPQVRGVWLIEFKCLGEALRPDQARWRSLAEALAAQYPEIRYRLVDARNALEVAAEMGFDRLQPKLVEMGCTPSGEEERDDDDLTPRQRAEMARLMREGGLQETAARRVAVQMV